jgi:TetR/AcrR family transcriptional regulator, regulator of cefoperazone and chloramphenicol sensitivity
VLVKIGAPARRKGRRRTSSGYPRGTETRQRIINVALELFGKVGYERASMRDIAARAQVKATVLHYYFDGKRGLYFSCVEHIHARATQLLQDVLDQARRAMATKIGRDALIEVVCVIYERSAEHLLTTRELATWNDFLGWDNHNVPGEPRKMLEQGLRKDFMQLMWDLIGRITGKGSSDEDTRIRVLTLGAQLAVFELAPRRSLNDIGWSVVDEPALQKLKAIIREQTQAALRESCAAER